MQQHHHSDDDSNIDESHHVEAMEDIMVSECYDLSDLHQPPTKKTKTQHFAPITTAILGTHVGKSSIHKLRVLFDSGSSGSIIVAKKILCIIIQKWQFYLQHEEIKFILKHHPSRNYLTRCNVTSLPINTIPHLNQQNQSTTNKDDSKKSTEKLK